LLEPLTLVLARTAADAERFAGLGVSTDRVVIAGNIKYDIVGDERPLDWEDEVLKTAGERPIVIAGSSMEGEESMVLDALADSGANGTAPFLIVAPRHPERFESVARLLSDRGLSFGRCSSAGPLPAAADAFLIDTIGELARAYRLARIAFIGGSLVPTGGHNPLEAAVWGVPTLSGVHVHNFREVYDELTAAGGARLVADVGEFRAAAAAWLDEPAFAAAAGKAGREVIERNRGATERTVDALLGLIGEG
jgi:3-deoxy-D-manno-octulosonic-acid transferase